ncbi:MAG: cation-translocating P-type ATPase [Opitutaceae bacterium]|nr:cation-translocating P-type ATPase [Opitutaceae bacterium]
MSTIWTETLADFLRSQPGIGGMRIDTSRGTVSVATLGDVDLTALETSLSATVKAVEDRLSEKARVPAGFAVRQEGTVTEITGPTCETAPRFWKWQEVELREPLEAEEHETEWRMLAGFAAVCAVLGGAGFFAERWHLGPSWLPHLLSLGALVAGGWDAAIDSWENLRKGKVEIHFLMLVVAAGAVAIGAWDEAVLLLFLFSASGAMEEFAMDRTHREVSALLKSAPKRATVVDTSGAEVDTPVESLQLGDRVRVKPGEAFPTDGGIVSGKSASDESALTGESVPVEKGVGDTVFSGTLNLWGAVDFTVTRLPSESTLQKIIRLIKTAQKLKAPSERFTDRFGTGYTYAVLGVSTAMFLVWWLILDLPAFANEPGVRSAFYRAMTLLVVASPCALVLSIPSAILAAIAWGARHGVLFRGGAAIEKLADITAVAMDKTGTLTTGELAVLTVESFPPGREAEILDLAYSLETNSQHPLARAIVRHAKANGAKVLPIEEFSSITGQGVRGRLGQSMTLLGRRELLEHGPLSGWAGKLPPAPADLSEVWVVGRDVVGRLLLRDQIRAESSGVLAELKRRGILTVMLTGDRRHTAETVAKELGLDEVKAGLSPEDKVAAIQQLRASGRKVAMVGDGVNDAPSLAAADVSVAMGARGSDAALEQAEVILMHDRIENFLAAYRLSVRAKRIIRQNLTISLGVVGVMVLATAFGAVPLAIGVAAHEGSTLVVCINSLRLLFGRNQST